MRILAVDFGDARTGLATCDPMETLATPAGCIREKNFIKVLEAVAEFAKKECCESIVVGFPKNMDGSEGARAQKCADFAHQLAEKVNMPVELFDERCSTMAASRLLNASGSFGKKRKQQIDTASAVVILEDYLRFRANRKGSN